MTKPLPAFLPYCINVNRNEEEDEDWCHVEGIEGLVLGLVVVEEGDRCGVLIVKDKGGIEHRFEVTVTHMSPIPEDAYTIIYACGIQSSEDCGWMVGRSLPGGKFEKVSMLINSRRTVKKRTNHLKITERHQYILI